MAPVADYSTTPSDNTSISGLTVSDATVADTLDNIIRQMMADIRSADNANAKTADNETITGNWTIDGDLTFNDQAQVRTALGFSQLLAASGHVTLPGGVIIQWFRTSAISSGANLATSWPRAFPTECASVVASYSNLASDVAANSVFVAQVRAVSTTSVTIRNLGPATAQFFVIAVGY